MTRFSHLYDPSWLLKSCRSGESVKERLVLLCGVSEERVISAFQPFGTLADRRSGRQPVLSVEKGGTVSERRAGTPFWAAVKSSLAGRYMEAAETLLDWTAALNDDSRAWMVEASLRFTLGCLASVSLEHTESRQLSGYIALCIQVQPLSVLYVVEPRLMRFALLKGRKAARWLMDSHNIGLMNILADFQSIRFPRQCRYGSLFGTSEQGTGFVGLSGEYRPENGLFFGAYHLAIGHPRLALDHFLLLSREKTGTETFADEVYRPWEALAMGLTGDFELAQALLLRYLRSRHPWRNAAAVHYLQIYLVHELLDVRNVEGALEHLDSLLAGVSRGGVMTCWVGAQVALARYHAVCGRLETAWRILKTTLGEAEASGIRYAPPLPFFLELLQALHVGGCPDVPGYEYEELLERYLDAPNLTLRHVALRLRASALMEGGDLTGAVAVLKQCRTFFVEHGLVWEAAKTIALLALAYLRRHDRRTALRFIIEAYPAFNAHEGLYDLWPQELLPLLPSRGVPTPRDRTVPLQRQLMRLLLELDAGSEHFLRHLLGAFCRVLGASRAAFWTCSRDGRAELLESSGVSTAEFATRERLRIVKEAEENIPFMYPLSGGQGTGLSRGMGLLLPVSHGDESWCCLCLEGENWLWSADDLTEELLAQLKEMAEIPVRRWLTGRPAAREASSSFLAQDELISVGGVMRSFLEKADRVAAVDASVLLFGETGAGKELVARRIHRMSGRQGPFIAVNLSSIPEELFESEMLGYEKGAFTGANRQKKGILELVDGGTLFLDELPDISPRFQVKLLRILQERNFMRLGGTQTIHSDFRLIAATNRNLKEEVRKGRFRADLYYRICVVMLSIPPLRERKEDILAIARHYLRHFSGRYHREVPDLSAADSQRLCSYAWPGNIRELRNVMAQAAALSDSDHLYLALEDAEAMTPPEEEPAVASAKERKLSGSGETLQEKETAGAGGERDVLSVLERLPSLEELENRYIQEVLKITSGRISGPKGAAALLGINRTTLYKKMKGRTSCENRGGICCTDGGKEG